MSEEQATPLDDPSPGNGSAAADDPAPDPEESPVVQLLRERLAELESRVAELERSLPDENPSSAAGEHAVGGAAGAVGRHDTSPDDSPSRR